MGGKGGGGQMPYQDDLGRAAVGTIFNQIATHDPNSANLFRPGTKLGSAYSDLSGGAAAPSFQAPKQVNPYGPIYSQTAANIGLNTSGGQTPRAGNAQQGKSGSSEHAGAGIYKGGGALTSIPSGAPSPQASGQTMTGVQGQGTSYGGGGTNPNMNINQAYNFVTPKMASYSPVSYNPQQFKMLQDVGTSQIAQGSHMAQQDLMRQMGARGLGQSGLAIQAGADLYNRGAGQQMSDLANQLGAQKMGLDYQSGITAQGLNAASNQLQGQLDLQRQGMQAGELQGRQGQNIQAQLGLGQLGLGEQAQQLGQIQADQNYSNLLGPIAGALAQSSMAAAASKGGGKGK